MCMYVGTYVHVCVCVRFPNWTGIVVEVKRGQLKRERVEGGGHGERAGRGSGALGEQQFLTSKKTYRVDKR